MFGAPSLVVLAFATILSLVALTGYLASNEFTATQVGTVVTAIVSIVSMLYMHHANRMMKGDMSE